MGNIFGTNKSTSVVTGQPERKSNVPRSSTYFEELYGISDVRESIRRYEAQKQLDKLTEKVYRVSLTNSVATPGNRYNAELSTNSERTSTRYVEPFGSIRQSTSSSASSIPLRRTSNPLKTSIITSTPSNTIHGSNKLVAAQTGVSEYNGGITASTIQTSIKNNSKVSKTVGHPRRYTDNNRNQKKGKPKVPLKSHTPTKEIRNLFHNNFKNSDRTNTEQCSLTNLIKELQLTSNRLTRQNYLDALQLFVDTEDLHCEDAIKVYDRKSEKIELEEETGFYILKIPNLIDSRPTISVNNRLTIKACRWESTNDLIYGTVLDIQPDFIEVGFKEAINTSIRYDVCFLSNRTTFRLEKLAIELMRQKNLVPFMFPTGDRLQHSANAYYIPHNFTWYNKSVATNLEQQTVIENIYQGTSYPYPYILFGPPGTGKTTTLVESILQLSKNKRNTRILVVSTSNFTCNVISKRLLEFLSETEIFRLFAKSQELVMDKIDENVVNVSNLKEVTHYHPEPAELYPYRIVVATLATSGRLIQEGFKTNHFTHLFIDECGSCTEGASLIPIAGLISSYNTINANIVLAGDPLQLGPVIQSKYAESLGYGVSMIERLMEFPLYKKDAKIGDYNNKFISKLRINYRSHKNILHISNQLFYDNELKALGSKEVTDRLINWRYLPNPKFPILFEAVFGESKRENDSPSLYNKQEINVVISYLKLLVNKNINGNVVRQSDIGVISPYRKQNQKIRAQCDFRKWKDIEVASVEAFQGNEKRIIILSTVRSNVESMGFLSSERRLNVALTRAQAMLIIIGDPKVLMKDKCWYQLLKFCHDNNAFCGAPFDFYY